MCTWLRPNVRGICAVGFEEEPGPADERRDVVGVESEAEVAVAIGRRCGGEHERIGRARPQDGAHLAEVVGDEVDRARAEARPSDVRQEVRHVTEPVAEAPCRYGRSCSACIWWTRTPESRVSGSLDRIEQRDRLAVGERNDDVGVRSRCDRAPIGRRSTGSVSETRCPHAHGCRPYDATTPGPFDPGSLDRHACPEESAGPGRSDRWWTKPRTTSTPITAAAMKAAMAAMPAICRPSTRRRSTAGGHAGSRP